MNIKQNDSWDALVHSPPLKRASRLGVDVFVAFAPFALLIVLLILLGGPEQKSRGSLIRFDLLLFTYLAGAAVTGVLIGLMLPMTRYFVGAIVTGFLAGLPWAAGIGLTVDRGYAHWTTGHTDSTLIAAAALGGMCGVVFHRAHQSPDHPVRRVVRGRRGYTG